MKSDEYHAGGERALWSRRRLLQVGAVGSMLTLPELLHGMQRSSAQEVRRGSDVSCIFIMQQGGPSHIDTWDMKPASPAEIRGPLKPIATTVPGIHICELMPRLARLAHRYSILRSLSHSSADHQVGVHICLSGHSQPVADAPYFGSILSRTRPAACDLPSYIWLQEMEAANDGQYQSGGFLGVAHAPFRIGKANDNFATPGFRVTALEPPEGVPSGRVLARRQLLDSVNGAAPAERTTPADRMGHFQQRAFDLITGPAARRALDLSREPAPVRDRYGHHPLGQNLLAARRLIEAGVRLVSVNAFTGFEPNTVWPPVVNVWDMHGAANRPELSIFRKNTYGLPWCLPRLDEAVSALFEDLDQRGMMETTLVVLLGEFGRTPRINPAAGRDHWPHCFAAVLAGAGVREGALYGQSDKYAAYPKDHPVSPDDFGATILHALGVTPDMRLHPDDFSRRASSGMPLLDLFTN
jgi:hypothetical protein